MILIVIKSESEIVEKSTKIYTKLFLFACFSYLKDVFTNIHLFKFHTVLYLNCMNLLEVFSSNL